MTRSRKILAPLGMLLVLALAGCVRFQADLKVSPDNTLDGDIVVAVITNDEPGPPTTLGMPRPTSRRSCFPRSAARMA